MSKCLVTGASGSIGSAIKNEIDKSGEYETLGLNSQVCDLSDPESVNSYLSSVNLDNVSALVFCAGINEPKSLIETNDVSFKRTLEVNLLGHKKILDQVLPSMSENKFGRIVAVSSLYSNRARAGRWAYSASKAALEALIRSIAVEYSSENIIANIVQPGFIDTALTRKNNSSAQIEKIIERIPIGRLGTSEEIARVVEFLLSSKNTYITGQSIVVDGGVSII